MSCVVMLRDNAFGPDIGLPGRTSAGWESLEIGPPAWPAGGQICPKPYKFIGFGDIHGPKPYKFIGFLQFNHFEVFALDLGADNYKDRAAIQCEPHKNRSRCPGPGDGLCKIEAFTSLAVLRAKLKIKNPRIRAGIGQQPTFFLGK